MFSTPTYTTTTDLPHPYQTQKNPSKPTTYRESKRKKTHLPSSDRHSTISQCDHKLTSPYKSHSGALLAEHNHVVGPKRQSLPYPPNYTSKRRVIEADIDGQRPMNPSPTRRASPSPPSVTETGSRRRPPLVTQRPTSAIPFNDPTSMMARRLSNITTCAVQISASEARLSHCLLNLY